MKRKIILASPEYTEQIRDIELECTSAPWSEKLIREDFSNENSKVFLMLETMTDKVLGHIGFKTVLNEGHIHTVCVKKDYRKQGIATEILNVLIEDALQNKIKEIYLEVRESNENALSLYEKAGFRVMGKRKNFYKNPAEDGVLMTYFALGKLESL